MSKKSIKAESGFVGNELCLDFANTAGWHASNHPTEHLQTFRDLVEWAGDAELINSAEKKALDLKGNKNPRGSARALAQAISFREALYRLFSSQAIGEKPTLADIGLLNEQLASFPAGLQMKLNDDSFVTEWKAPTNGWLGFLAPVAWSAADLLSSDRLQRVKQCAGDPCGWLFVDTTRNHSRRWCDINDCGNRAKAKRFYYRHKVRS